MSDTTCIDIVTRDLGYGSEKYYAVEGAFTGEIDIWGKYTFEPATCEFLPTMYLFLDEWEDCNRIIFDGTEEELDGPICEPGDDYKVSRDEDRYYG